MTFAPSTMTFVWRSCFGAVSLGDLERLNDGIAIRAVEVDVLADTVFVHGGGRGLEMAYSRLLAARATAW